MSSRSIGIIVPPSNPTVEPELRHMLPAEVDTYVARLPVLDGSLETRLARYVECLPETAGSLAHLGIGSVISACTGCSYSSDVAADQKLAEAIGSTLGVPAVTAAGAVLLVLQHLSVRTLTIVSPYPDWLTNLSASYWRAAGLEVVEIVQISGTGRIYDLTSDAVLKVLDAALADSRATQPGHAILITGTGAPSLDALNGRADDASIPILSSNLASAWAALDAMNARALIEFSPSAALRKIDQQIDRNAGR